MLVLAQLLLALSLATIAAATCPHRQQFWSNDLQRCQNCSTCHGLQVVLRPCGVDRDTICGPLSSLGVPGFVSNAARRNATSEVPNEAMEDRPFSSMEALVFDWQLAAWVAGLTGLLLVFFLIVARIIQQLTKYCCRNRRSTHGQWALVRGSESHQHLYMDALLERKQDDDPRYH